MGNQQGSSASQTFIIFIYSNRKPLSTPIAPIYGHHLRMPVFKYKYKEYSQMHTHKPE